MDIDGKTKVKERIKVFESNDFTTYLYKFENGNEYKDTVPKWKPKDMTAYKRSHIDTWLENNYWKKM